MFALLRIGVSQKLFFCFDGTGNEPDDSMEDRSLLSIEDSGITNVLKLHLLLGGDLKDGQHVPNQHSFYFSGIGTRGSRLKRSFDAAFVPPRLSLNDITEETLELIKTHYQDGDEAFLFGFSRGTAIARRVAGVLPDGVPVRFMGVFDTVASIGKPNLDDDRDPCRFSITTHPDVVTSEQVSRKPPRVATFSCKERSWQRRRRNAEKRKQRQRNRRPRSPVP